MDDFIVGGLLLDTLIFKTQVLHYFFGLCEFHLGPFNSLI